VLGHFSLTLTACKHFLAYFFPLNLGGFLYRGQIERVWLDCSKESKDIGSQSAVQQEPLNQRTYHADNFVLAPVVVVITH
jgi:hypothetical protein